jgi:folylpolyglutamate synthase
MYLMPCPYCPLLRYQQQQALKRVRFIHVAGTKGKGTTCLYCESILTAYQNMAGDSVKIGCLTSPHVTNIRERIRLDASSISERLFARYFFEMWDQMERYYRLGSDTSPSLPGYPGFLTLLGLYIIVKEGVNVAIVETGIGGENDSTNVIPSPTVVGITTIGLDHVNVLGSELRSIAWHKAGIFKQDSPAYTVEQDSVALEVLKERAEEKNILGPLGIVSERLVADYAVIVSPDLAFQRQNASLAIVLSESCLKVMRPDFKMTQELVKSIEKTELPGRSQIIQTGRLTWYISSAHNEISIEAAAMWYEDAVKHSE